jgi:hypothetical protein
MDRSELIRPYKDAEEWRRSGIHTDSGPYSVDTWLEIYAAHCHDHADQIARAVAESRAPVS